MYNDIQRRCIHDEDESRWPRPHVVDSEFRASKFVQFPRPSSRGPPLVWISDKTANFRVESFRRRVSGCYALAQKGRGVGGRRWKMHAEEKRSRHAIIFSSPSSPTGANNARPDSTLCANNWLRAYRTSVIPSVRVSPADAGCPFKILQALRIIALAPFLFPCQLR